MLEQDVALSVLDNVLVVHSLGAKVALLFDTRIDSVNPIAAPLPIGTPSPSAPPQANGSTLPGGLAGMAARSWPLCWHSWLASPAARIYDQNWRFELPNLLVDGNAERGYADTVASAS